MFVYEATILSGLAACNAVTDDLFLDGNNFYTNLLSPLSSFSGISGDVKLDPTTGTRSAETATYLMLNFLESPYAFGNITPVGTHEFTNGSWAPVSENVMFVYNDGSNERPPAPSNYAILQYAQDVESVYLNPVVKAFSYIFMAIAILLAVFFASWTVKKRNSRIVKASQPVFLIIVCFGVIISGKENLELCTVELFA